MGVIRCPSGLSLVSSAHCHNYERFRSKTLAESPTSSGVPQQETFGYP